MNFMKNLRASDTIEEPMNSSNDINSTIKGFFPDPTTLVNVDKMHLYKDTLGAAGGDLLVSSSFGPY